MPPQLPDSVRAIICNCPDALSKAKSLAVLTGLPLRVDVDVNAIGAQDYFLVFDQAGTSLVQAGARAAGAITAEFVIGQANHRRLYGGGAGQLIAKAVGIKAGQRPGVLDATAGLGRDAFVLATLGCEVQLVERSPIVHALLSDGLERAHRAADAGLAAVLARMSVLYGNAHTYLQTLPAGSYPEVIYLDPMFPERHKSARVKKEMQAFHAVVGRDADAADLLALALDRVRYRVVAKRPRKSPAIEGRAPSFVLDGKSSRYDIYTIRKIGG